MAIVILSDPKCGVWSGNLGHDKNSATFLKVEKIGTKSTLVLQLLNHDKTSFWISQVKITTAPNYLLGSELKLHTDANEALSCGSFSENDMTYGANENELIYTRSCGLPRATKYLTISTTAQYNLMHEIEIVAYGCAIPSGSSYVD